MSNYKSTLNLPKTDFPMRAALSKQEPKSILRWNHDRLYELVRSAKRGKKIFLLHDGPPYANGKIHLGHAVNKILKDIIIKSKSLSGFDSPYIPGWDCHGLPIELQVEKKYGKPGNKFLMSDFRIKCRKYAIKQMNNQRQDFMRLGILGDWSHPYLTMNFKTEANIMRIFGQVIKNGYVYKGTKPVYWCTDCQSALAEAEVEYEEITSLSMYVMFEAVDQNAIKHLFNLSSFVFENVFLVIWTTTPWTLPANRAISLSPNSEYALVKIKNQAVILAKNLVEKVMKCAGINSYSILSVIFSKKLELMLFKHPFLNFHVPVILGDHVTLKEGTGAVHTAGGHGLEDYYISQQYNLEIINLVGEDGIYLPGISSSLEGVHVFQANNVILDTLLDHQTLFHAEQLKHNYPHCWRHKTPIIFRTTPQWFIRMGQKAGLREKSLKAIENVTWTPMWGKKCIESMLINRPDWCISRQRFWGIPIPLLVHKQTQKLHPCTSKLIEKIAKCVEIDGVQAWWDINLSDIIGDDAHLYEKVTDTLDVWFDSGSTHTSVVKMYPKFSNHKIDMYLEGSDQYRGWFMSSLIVSTAIKSEAPCRHVLTHGFTVDGRGKKMSKSVGNTISPMDVINKFGADILRLWVASTDYSKDMAISEEILDRISSNYRRIRNTARFLLANLNDFDPEKDMIQPKNMIVFDRWAVSCAKAVQKNIIHAYDSYNFHEVVKLMINFCSVEMGSLYLDVIKDRQYTAKINSLARRSCQTALFHIIEALIRWMMPIISFTADEIWNYLPGKREKYIFTDEWYQGLFSLNKNDFMNDDFWQEILKVRSEINKFIEKWRTNKQIRSSLELSVTLYVQSSLAEKLIILGDELKFIFLTSSTKVLDYASATSEAYQSELLDGVKILLKKVDGEKCPRCWHYSTDINQSKQYSSICQRCVCNTIGKGEIRQFV